MLIHQCDLCGKQETTYERLAAWLNVSIVSPFMGPGAGSYEPQQLLFCELCKINFRRAIDNLKSSIK